MSAKLVSVIIPTYNRDSILKEAVDSVLTQTFDDFELIVVDDGSTDSTDKILDRYKGRLTVLKQQNKGVSSARNAGILHSKGELIAFLDSDDLWLKNKLDKQVRFFNSNPDCQICQTQEIWIRNSVRVNQGKRHKKLRGMIFEQSLNLCLVSPSAVMLRRDLLNRVGLFDESLYACEDYDLWLRILSNNPAGLIDQALVIRRAGHKDQLSAGRGLDKYRIKAIKKILEKGKLSKAQHTAAVKTLRQKSSIYAAGCKKRGRIEEAEYYISLIEKFI